MRATKFAAAVGASLLLCALASPAGAQEGARQRAPIVRVYSSNGSYALQTTSYVTPVVEVSENAYIFAVSMDVDGRIQVLHPDFPGISVRMLAHKQLNLPNFFAGFAQPNDGGGYYSSASYSGNGNYDDGYMDSRGTVIALASRAPFNLDLIERDGDWNIAAIRGLIEGRSPESAEQALASYLGAKGEPIGRDYMRFSGNRYAGYALGSYSSCDLYYGYAFAPTMAFNRFQAFNRIGQLRSHGQQVRILGYDICGSPIIAIAPLRVVGGRRPPISPRPPGDTTGFPRNRFPKHLTPRHPPESGRTTAAEGVFPRHSSLPQIGDVTITAPGRRRSEPGQILQGYRQQPGTMAPPQGRMPIERVTAPRSEPAAANGSTGSSQPLREYRPEPRSAAPPPVRVSDPPRQSPPPPPVVREPASSPPPPPPRVLTPITKSEPLRAPPPSKQ